MRFQILSVSIPARLLRKPEDASGAPAEPTAEHGPHRHIRSFALRRGHVTNAQRRAYEQIFPRIAIPYAVAPLDLAAAFGRAAPTVLEIGFGMGETTASIAQAHPEINFLCVEVF
ncbi:hypothetical protein FBR04_18220, partial [Betaproteobacteria bacterium PRO7]|nr:hypothetical protein [Betaproteobacteria bacterium PRO7]